MKVHKSDKNSVQLTVTCLKSGNICIIPTDTVYGFSGIVDTQKQTFHSDNKIRMVKGRSESKPFICLISKPSDINQYTNVKIPADILNLWPGPLTIIVPIKSDSDLISNSSTVAFRCPGDKWLREIINQVGSPIFSTSVNFSGLPICETEQEITSKFDKLVDLIVCDGDKKGALPSTIISIENGQIKLVRAGEIQIDSKLLINK